jgi:hypothetical protein
MQISKVVRTSSELNTEDSFHEPAWTKNFAYETRDVWGFSFLSNLRNMSEI